MINLNIKGKGGEEGGSADVEGRRGGEDWKVDGCLLVLGEHPE